MSVINSALRSAAACALLAASSFAPASAEPSSDVLVVYFSATGTTQKAAEAVATELKADLFAIEPVQPYTAADLDYRDPESRSSKEHADPSVRPEYKGDPAGWDQYHTVLIGYPIWWGLAPNVVYGFVEKHDFSGKTVGTFSTSATSGHGGSGTDLAAKAGKGDWKYHQGFKVGDPEDAPVSWARSLK